MRKQIFYTKAGFSLIEVIIASGLVVMFMLAGSSILRDIYQVTSLDRNKIEIQNDLSFSMRYIGGLLQMSAPSFNTVKGNLDDNGKEFFEHIYDASTVGWPEADASRTLTLSATSGRLEFLFLTNNADQLDQLFYTPLDAYDPPEPVMDMNSSSPLVYNSFNKGSAVSKFAPKVWVQNELVLVKVPIPLRFVAADGSVNMNLPPREHSFLGKVNGNDLVQDSFNSHTYGTHPVTLTAVNTVDIFLRTVPTVGGSSPVVEVVSVKGYKIALVKNSTTGHYDAYSYVYNNGSFSNPFLIAPKINTIEFKRESVGLQIIGVKMSVDQPVKK